MRAEQKRRVDVLAAMAKLAATEVLKDLESCCPRLVGPDALIVGDPLEHWFRHVQIGTIYGGSNEIQRNIIVSRGFGLPRG